MEKYVYLKNEKGEVCYAHMQEGHTEITKEEYESIVAKMRVPRLMTMRQARLQLLNLGLLDDVEAVIANITDETTKKMVQIEWEYAKDVERNSATISMLANAVGLDDTGLDNLFIEGSKL